MTEASQHKLEPPLRLEDGRMIRTVTDAIALLRDHEMRPGVDDRDEVLHNLERARSDAELAQALRRFRVWAETWAATLPVSTKPRAQDPP